jgi:hypothetical protein
MANESRWRGAGVFDIRLVIALLAGIYGLVLTVLGLGFTSEEDIDKAAGVNINLWTGLAMLIFAVLFVAWARLRPIAVPTEPETVREDEHAG